MLKVDKKVKGQLVGVDANIYAVFGYFKKQALRQKWTNEEVDFVIEKAKATKNYHLCLATIMEYMDMS